MQDTNLLVAMERVAERGKKRTQLQAKLSEGLGNATCATVVPPCMLIDESHQEVNLIHQHIQNYSLLH